MDKFLDAFRPPTETMTIYRLGLEFLQLYDGKFNYREGHTVRSSIDRSIQREKIFVLFFFFKFVMSFEKRFWSLTIEEIKCKRNEEKRIFVEENRCFVSF